MLVARFLLGIFAELASRTDNTKVRLIATSLWGFIKALDSLKDSGLFLNDSQLAELEKSRRAALFAHSQLGRDAIASGSHLFRTIPKHHYVHHLLRAPLGFNVAAAWCFADEDFIGRLIRINRRSVDPAQLMRRYLLRLHLVFHVGRRTAPQL